MMNCNIRPGSALGGASWTLPDIDAAREAFRTDGVVHLPGVLHPEWVELIAIGIQRNLAYPSPNAKRLYPGSDREMLMDHTNFA
jgi:hypothetical protein